MDAFRAPAIAVFCAQPALRSRYPEFREVCVELDDRTELSSWLKTVFSVLEDEPLLVIEPASGKGLLARLSGTDVNFTLTMLLMRQFPGAADHPRLTEKAASVLADGPQCSNEGVTGVWNLYKWQALRKDYTLPEGQRATEHWIWNEGTPADIAVFEGRRVILLGPAAYRRSWPAQRTFAAMRPSLKIEKVLSADEVRKWLEKMVQAGAYIE